MCSFLVLSSSFYLHILLLFLGNCTLGEELNDKNNRTNECVPCSPGTYAPNVWMEDCIPCGEFRTTLDGPGATSEDQCECTL